MSDDDTTPTLSTLSDSSTVEGGNLYAILMDASGDVEMAALNGERYTPTDLQTLTGNSLSALKRLVADIAIWRCYQRRPDLNQPMPQQSQVAANLLNALASGERVFGLQEVVDASHLDMTTDQPEDVVTRNGMVVFAEEMFGRRNNRNRARGTW